MASVEVVTDPPLVVGLIVEVTSEPPDNITHFFKNKTNIC